MSCLRFILCIILTVSLPVKVFCANGSLRPVEEQQKNDDKILAGLNAKLYSALTSATKPDELSVIVDEIDNALSKGRFSDTVTLSDAYFLTGSFSLVINKYHNAITRLSKAAELREAIGLLDIRYTYCLSNIATTHLKLGDYSRALDYELLSLKTLRPLVGSDTSSLVADYVNLSSTYLQMNEIDKAQRMAETGIEITKRYPGVTNPGHLASLYHDLGSCYARKTEYSKSLSYYRQALGLYEKGQLNNDESKQILLNDLARTYRVLGLNSDAEIFYIKALQDIDADFLSDNYWVFVDYAEFLSETGRPGEGSALIDRGLMLVNDYFGKDSKEYCNMLSAKASFLYNAKSDGNGALDTYRSCFPYLEAHPGDFSLRNSIMLDYISVLKGEGMYSEALEAIETLLGDMKDSIALLVDDPNPGARASLSPGNLKSLLSVQYAVYDSLAAVTGKPDHLFSALETGKMLIRLYDKLRPGMSDESRLFLSADARAYYLGVIAKYSELSSRSEDSGALNNTFEYIERSKMAAFLASMREVNATRFSLPQDLAEYDSNIQKQIGYFRELITNESDKPQPDSLRIATWEQKTFALLRARDSLISVFEKQFPDYYRLKYSTDVVPLKNTGKIIGRNVNLLSYVMAGDEIFIFLSNRQTEKIITVNIDSSFYSTLGRFRTLLTRPPGKENAREEFDEFIDLGYELYGLLLAPAVPYLKGDRVIISPDNILSYLPFETLITERFRSNELLYREAPFVLKKYRISYIYSVTLFSEIKRKLRNVSNRVLAFAPSYENMEVPDTLLAMYPNLRGRIAALPYAPLEVKDAVERCGGEAYLDRFATEQLYKQKASKFSIIHLAMHTIVDDQHPAYSKMIFAKPEDSSEDGFLNTYEVFSTPLNAMMVVLSSCNTGTGMLSTGEGILSLARGFLFAGSNSVVMSMWEVEDYAGSEVIKAFYKQIWKGKAKSTALRNARMYYLEKADQMRSHPYFWAALVIYGDDAPLFYNRSFVIPGLALLFAAFAILAWVFYKGPRS